jgi:hypothetical protein
MESLGDELMRYLKEAGEEIGPKTEKEPEKKRSSLFSPYISVFKGFSELFGIAQKAKNQAKPKKPSRTDIMKLAVARREAETAVKATTWQIYHHFKKHHRMLNW